MRRVPRRTNLLAASGTVALCVLVGVVLVYQSAGDQPPAVFQPQRERTDWPLWGGSLARNMVNRLDRNIPTTWDAESTPTQNILWTAALGSKAYGGPIIAGGKIYVGTNNQKPRDPAVKGDKGVMMCFDEATGKFLWQIVFDKLPNGRVQDWPEEGIVSAPAVVGDLLYFVSNRCELVCASTAGVVQWTLDMRGTLGVFPHNLATCSPLVVGDTVFLCTSNGVDEGHINIPAPEAPSFLAVDRHRGKVVWSSNLPSVHLSVARKQNPIVTFKELVDKGLILMHGQWGNPSYAEATPGKPQVIFPGGDGWLYSFDPKSGELLWKFDCNPKGAVYFLGGKGTRNDFCWTSPVIADGKLYIGVGQDPEHLKGVGHLWCVDITKVPTNRDRDLSPFSDPKDTNPRFDPKDPKNKDSALVWHYGGAAPPGSKRRYLFGRTMSTCAVHDGLVYAAEFDGYVHCFDAKTGAKFWEHRMDADTWCSPCCVDGKVYLGNEDGEVLVFQAGKVKQLLQTNTMPGTPAQVRVPPVVANGVLYILTENPCKMYAIKK